MPIPSQNRFSKEMTKEDIIRIEKDFAEVASKAKKAGFNGVEIHGAHYYLIIILTLIIILKISISKIKTMISQNYIKLRIIFCEFLSPLFNKRTDEYGGSDENRARFLLAISAKIIGIFCPLSTDIWNSIM